LKNRLNGRKSRQEPPARSTYDSREQGGLMSPPRWPVTDRAASALPTLRQRVRFQPRFARGQEDPMLALYRKRHCGGTSLSAASGRRHAVVVGGSMAGMLAARALADHFDAVTLLERDHFPETPAARAGLPQGRHGHALLERGRRIV